MTVPAGRYISARSAKGRAEHSFGPDSENSGFTRLEYVPYAPPQSAQSDSSPVPDQYPTSSTSTSTWANRSNHQPEAEKSSSRSISPSSSGTPSSDGKGKQALVPLSYLEEQPFPRRHPTDENALMMLTLRCLRDRQNWLHSGITSSMVAP